MQVYEQRFYEGQLPRLITALERIAIALERLEEKQTEHILKNAIDEFLTDGRSDS